MVRVLLVTLGFSLLPVPVLADPLDDATYIVELNSTAVEMTLKADTVVMGIQRSVARHLEDLGATIADPGRFRTELFGDLPDRLRADTGRAAIRAYVAVFDADELGRIADYYRTPEIRSLIAAGIPIRPDLLDEDVAQLLESRAPDLMKYIAPAIEENVAEAMARLTMERLATIISMPDVVSFDREERRAEVVEALRSIE
ncbi:hypothetical protein jaqu_24280 [Jannaschia aquimarina]|uniref:DUF2059 domain-containing protein n=2 Tax=Jannaschia aquimarina TaxID=935700 RepID=A0A0D1D7C6_9RHOB|nr:hypothetical protein [Jannaschia aquimarina]KIT15848.1 hypothetical protein jaqu_24280 [Jannaschia aquimarina]SNT09959.1 hypothetical protein SAMN05421775_105244 [Jannaschia aquimarina]